MAKKKAATKSVAEKINESETVASEPESKGSQEQGKTRGRKMVVCPTCKKPTKTRQGKCIDCGTAKPGKTTSTAPRTARATKGGSYAEVADLIVLAKRIGKKAALDIIDACLD